jgi:translation initiation factor IF-1
MPVKKSFFFSCWFFVKKLNRNNVKTHVNGEMRKTRILEK